MQKQICPKCNKEYKGYPALSRKDNKTKICSSCGFIESLEAFKKLGKKYYGKTGNL